MTTIEVVAVAALVTAWGWVCIPIGVYLAVYAYHRVHCEAQVENQRTIQQYMAQLDAHRKAMGPLETQPAELFRRAATGEDCSGK